jgi:hypothetical protein
MAKVEFKNNYGKGFQTIEATASLHFFRFANEKLNSNHCLFAAFFYKIRIKDVRSNQVLLSLPENAGWFPNSFEVTVPFKLLKTGKMSNS